MAKEVAGCFATAIRFVISAKSDTHFPATIDNVRLFG